MKIIKFFNTLNPPTPLLKGGILLALGAESAGGFAVFKPPKSPFTRGMRKKNPPPSKGGLGGFYLSDNFGDLLDEKNFLKYKKAVLEFLKKNKLRPSIILTDLHPLYKTTLWGAELAKKFRAKHIQVQHHLAHIFSAIGEQFLKAKSYKLKAYSIGIALDGTGYGLDGKIWGGEIFKISPLIKGAGGTNRIGHLENQIMLGADLAVREPARMLIAILDKIPPLIKGAGGIYTRRMKQGNPMLYAQTTGLPRSSEADSLAMTRKNFIYNFVKKFYTRNQFELLYNQLQNNFNCQETSSTGRILDAVSLLLGFCGNERKYKHEPIDLLEQNSTSPYGNLKPKINSYYNKELRITNYELCTTHLFKYLIENVNKDKKRLAATAQLYIAEGLYEITKKIHNSKFIIHNSYLSGGISNNKIISNYFESKGVYANKKIPVKSKFNGVPRGDAGISFGQIIFLLFTGIKKY